jgi:hypothetical protein
MSQNLPSIDDVKREGKDQDRDEEPSQVTPSRSRRDRLDVVVRDAVKDEFRRQSFQSTKD